MAWTPATPTATEWGQIRVTVDGKDVTFWRKNPAYPTRQLTQVLDWQDTDPYGSNNARLAFPQVTEFDAVGEGDLAWLAEGKRVRIDHHNNGARVKNLFIGFIDRLEITDAGLTATCKGDLLGRLALTLHQPPIGRRQVRDVGEAISRELGTYDGRGRFTLIPQQGVETGIEVAVRGDRTMTRLGFIDYCLGMAIKADGDSLTVLPDPTEDATTYRMQWRDLTTVQATLSAGAHGVKVNLSRDIVDSPNRIYGEGVSTTGERWRGAVYPNLGDKTVPTFPTVGARGMQLGDTDADTSTGSGVTVMVRELFGNGDLAADDKATHTFTQEVKEAVEDTQERAGLPITGTVDETTWQRIFSAEQPNQSFAQAEFRPLAEDSALHKYRRAGDGTIIDLNPDFDVDLLAVEEFVNYGESTTKRQAKRNARARRLRNGGWAGTITLTQDPTECSRFDLRAGNNIRLRHLKGTGSDGLRLHISSVQVDWQSGAVTLAVATRGRHFLDLATRKQRNLEARRDPGYEFRHLLRRSAGTQDSISGWEGESGAGIVRPTAVTGGTWNEGIQVVAAEVGVISTLRLIADGPTLFYCWLSPYKYSPTMLNSRLGDPSVWVDEEEREDVWAANSEWLLHDEEGRRMVEGWGTPDQPCGLGTKPYLNKSGNRSKWPVTGKHYDDGSWDFWTQDNFLWLYVWPAADTTIRGRMRIQLNDGL